MPTAHDAEGQRTGAVILTRDELVHCIAQMKLNTTELVFGIHPSWDWLLEIYPEYSTLEELAQAKGWYFFQRPGDES